MQLAMYKGPADRWVNKLGHWCVCVITLSRYSHCELVIDGVCWSASYRDGGVRSKRIDLKSGHWDVFEIKANAARALDWFAANRGRPYDWPGMLRVCPLLRWLPRRGDRHFCSEAVGAALGYRDSERMSPASLLRRAVRGVAR